MQTIEEFSCLHSDEENNEIVTESIVDSEINFKQKTVDHDII